MGGNNRWYFTHPAGKQDVTRKAILIVMFCLATWITDDILLVALM